MDSVPSAVNEIGRQIILCAIRVHRATGPGLLESIYRRYLAHALRNEGLSVEEEVWLPATFEGLVIERAYRVDLIVGGMVLVEVKATEAEHPAHAAQVLTYLRLSGLPLGYLMNFHVRYMRDGVRRFAMTRA